MQEKGFGVVVIVVLIALALTTSSVGVLIGSNLYQDPKEEQNGLEKLAKLKADKEAIEVNPSKSPATASINLPPSPSPSILPPQYVSLSNCQKVTKNGNYKLTQNLSSSTNCLEFADLSEVNLDCDHHAIVFTYSGSGLDQTAINIKNVNSLTIKNCILSSYYSKGEVGAYPSIYISHVEKGVITNNNFKTWFQCEYCKNFDISENNFENTLQVIYSSNMVISNNRLIANPKYKLPGNINLSNGDQNVVTKNTINGSWDGVPKHLESVGSDDGIILSMEKNDLVSENSIENVWDCGIETTYWVENTKFTKNVIKNAPICGIGAWYWNSWRNNEVSENIVSDSNRLFYFYRHYDLHNEEAFYFENNIFRNNTLTPITHNPNTDSTMFDFINIRGSIPQDKIKISNNTISNNDFGLDRQAPVFLPSSAFVDGGENRCQQTTDRIRSFLNCRQ